MQARLLSILACACLTACSLDRVGIGSDGGLHLDAPPFDAAEADGGVGDAEVTPDDTGAPDSGSDCDPLACAGRYCERGACAIAASCAQIHATSPTLPSEVVEIDPDGAGPGVPFEAFCEMGADGGGWTLLLKVDGASDSFAYDSPEWSASAPLDGSTPDLDEIQSRLAGYASMPFTEVRVGLRTSTETHWLVVPVGAPSLSALFAGAPSSTSMGRAAWLGALTGSSIQSACAVEGVNVGGSGAAARVRIGIVGDDQADCASPDSFLGVGGQQATIRIHAGNVARANAEGRRDLTAFGYVMVR